MLGKLFPLGFAVLACGCMSGGGAGALRTLSEHSPVPCCPRYSAAISSRTLSVPVAFRMADVDTLCVVKRTDWLGDAVGEAVFPAGKIIAREFGKVVKANFHVVSGDEVPVAVFSVSIDRATAKVIDGGNVESTVCVHVEVTSNDGSKRCYANTFEKTASARWENRNLVPLAVYRAIELTVNGVMSDWETRDSAIASLLKWKSDAAPQIVPPSLKSIEWTQVDDVWTGVCEVKCNGYEGFDAKSWANARIAVACRTKLGNIEPERVRVVYDDELFDEQSKKWMFAFRTFARTKMALSYDPMTRHGAITGDLELIAASSPEQAAELLKEYVFAEMESHGRLVKDTTKRHKGGVRFDDFETDKTYNLITIKFRLVQ